jgi:hypothetical protein
LFLTGVLINENDHNGYARIASRLQRLQSMLLVIWIWSQVLMRRASATLKRRKVKESTILMMQPDEFEI